MATLTVTDDRLRQKEKQFDCIKFKNELQNNLLKNSGAKSLREYADYANKLALKSSLHKRVDTMSTDLR